MKQITCPHCGDTYPDFDVAHVCSKGPYAPRLKPKMNERIEKLKESACPKIDWAGRYHVELNNGEKEKWMNEWFEKFAELIIQECIDKITTYDLVPGHSAKWEDIYDIHARLLQDLGEELKEHFGVTK